MTIYIFQLLFLGKRIYTKAQKLNSACVNRQSRLCDSFLSIHTVWEFSRYGLQEKTKTLILSFYFMLIGNGKALRLYSDTRAALPPLAWEVDPHFPVFLHYERRKTGSCSFTAALIGGKLDFPVFLRSERRKTGNCSFGCGSMRQKSFNPIFYPFFPSFACWWVIDRGLVPQSQGWTCVNNNWVK